MHLIRACAKFLRPQIMSNDIIHIKHLSIAFGRFAKQRAVDDVSFSIQKGQSLSLVGESGSGKSLTALAMMQLLPHTARVASKSQVLFNGRDLLTVPEKKMRQIRGRHLGMIFQDAMSAFNPVLTIGQQLHEVVNLHHSLKRQAARQHVLNLLEEVGIHDPDFCYRAYPHELSGGMRQRAMIAMALCGDPSLIIADEPTTALDVTIQAQVLDLLLKLKKTKNVSLLFISHDLAVVSKLADEIVVLKNGAIVEQAVARRFFQHPQQQYSKDLLAAIPQNHVQHEPAQGTPALLTVENLQVYFPIRKGILKRTVGHVKAVDNISFNLPMGQTMALVGESGSGKTTTGKAILRLLPVTAGNVRFAQNNLTTLANKAVRPLRANMQFIFQDPYASLNPRMLVVDCIAEGLLALKKCRSRKAATAKIDQLLEQVDLPLDAKWRYPHEFSGGQRQRICIARALALEPQLLILDEPTSALDVSIQMQILKLLQRLQQDLNLSYLLITHNLSVVAYMAHTVAVMYRGKIVEQGATKALLTNPQHDYTKQLLASVPTINSHHSASQNL